jgi:hypothetical protein
MRGINSFDDYYLLINGFCLSGDDFIFSKGIYYMGIFPVGYEGVLIGW